MPGSANHKLLPDYLAFVLDRLILPEPPVGDPFDPTIHGEGLAFDGTAEPPRPAENLFALAVGSQWLDRWSGANACVLVPSSGAAGNGPTGSDLRTLQSERDRVALFALRWNIDVHVWGRESPEAVGRAKDTERLREAFQILNNVARVMYLSTSGYGKWEGVAGVNNDTETMRYGELIVVTFSVSLPVYDYVRTKIPLPQVLQPAAGHPVVS
jgi:hypothetical protein